MAPLHRRGLRAQKTKEPLTRVHSLKPTCTHELSSGELELLTGPTMLN